MAASESNDGPVLSLVSKRLRALRKKHNRILQMEESIAQGKTLNKEQEEVLRSKPSVVAAIEELEKLQPQLSAAVQEEVNLALQHEQVSSIAEDSSLGGDSALQDLIKLLYFGSLFDVKQQSEFTSTMLTRTHERGCCLTYDYVTDEAVDLLGERDLDFISALSGLLISRPADSNLSHKSALQRCFEHAKLWLVRSEKPIEQNDGVTYAALREKLNKIMASDYFTATPEIKAPVDVAAANNYAPFQVQVTSPEQQVSVPAEEESSGKHDEHKVEDEVNHQEHESEIEANIVEETPQMVEVGNEDSADMTSVQREQDEHQPEVELNQGEWEGEKQQFMPRKTYQNQRGGRGGRRGFYGGRGGRSGSRGGGAYQNGRHQYHDQQGNYYPRNNYYNGNGRGRGGRGGGYAYGNGHPAAARGGGDGPIAVGASS